MEGIERFNQAPEIPIDTEVEGLTPGEVNLASALRLIERIEAQGEIDAESNKEALEMIADLEEQVRFFKEEGLPVPEKLTFVTQELKRLREQKQLSVRERFTREEPADDTEIAAARALAELEDLANPSI